MPLNQTNFTYNRYYCLGKVGNDSFDRHNHKDYEFSLILVSYNTNLEPT